MGWDCEGRERQGGIAPTNGPSRQSLAGTRVLPFLDRGAGSLDAGSLAAHGAKSGSSGGNRTYDNPLCIKDFAFSESRACPFFLSHPNQPSHLICPRFFQSRNENSVRDLLLMVPQTVCLCVLVSELHYCPDEIGARRRPDKRGPSAHSKTSSHHPTFFLRSRPNAINGIPTRKYVDGSGTSGAASVGGVGMGGSVGCK